MPVDRSPVPPSLPEDHNEILWLPKERHRLSGLANRYAFKIPMPKTMDFFCH